MKYNVPLVIDNNDSVSILLNFIRPNSVVLEFGCANGRMTKYMKEELGCSVYIVEYDEEAFSDAKKFAKEGICGDILQFEWLTQFGDTKFDFVIFADVLEHLSDPLLALSKSRQLLKEDGCVLVSVPNVGHNDVLIKLFEKKFEYTETGLLDDTHIHFFAEKSLEPFCQQAGFQIIKKLYTRCNTGESEQFAGTVAKINPVLRSIIDGRVNGTIYQFLLVLQQTDYVKSNSITCETDLDLRSSIHCKLYYDYGNGFLEEKSEDVEICQGDDEVFRFNKEIVLSEDLMAVRFDPVEGENCLLRSAGASVGTKALAMDFGKHLSDDNLVVLLGPDPQIVIDCAGYDQGILVFFAQFVPEGIELYAEAGSVLESVQKKLEQLIEQKSDLEKENYQLNTIVSTDLFRINELEQQLNDSFSKFREVKNEKELKSNTCLQLQQELSQMTVLYNDACRQSTDNYNKLVERSQAADYWEHFSETYRTSKSWIITKPLRAPRRLFYMWKHHREMIEKIKLCTVKFSIIMPVYNVDVRWLAEAINSVKAQSYLNWELCIVDDASTDRGIVEFLKKEKDSRIRVSFSKKNEGISVASNKAAKMATGEYLLLMDDDDVIAPEALMCFYECIKQSDADVIYSDHDIIDENGTHSCPFFKPDWSPDLLCSQMYIGHLVGFKRSLFEDVGGFRKEFDGSQDYDLIFRITEKSNEIKHISKLLYSWRSIPSSTAKSPGSKPYAQYAGLNAVQEHLDRVLGRDKAIVSETENFFVYDVEYKIENKVMVSVIIPTKDHADDLEKALSSIITKTKYDNYEIIILNNNSIEEKTYSLFERIQKEHVNVKVIDASYEFNWSKLNNHGMSVASGDVYLFLNNDVEILSCDWMDRMVSQALRPEVGVVGPLLLYEDGTIQHAGVVVGIGGYADHVYKAMAPIHCVTPFISPIVTRNVTAVTGACMAISKKTINKIGQFDDRFIVCGSDVEICIRAIQNGLVNIYDPHVKLIHFESKTRGSEIPRIDFEMSDKVYKIYRENGDPYYNNNLDYSSVMPTIIGGVNQKQIDGFMDVSVPEITPIHFRKVEIRRTRINILLPSLNPEHIFGGISTAYRLFKTIQEKTGFDCRIIITDAQPNDGAFAKFGDEFVFVDSKDDVEAHKMVLPFSDRMGKTIPVSDNDYFIFTGWWTAYCIQNEYRNWNETELKRNPFIYFIQDYEPGFYQWSTLYVMAESTYKADYEQIVIFNSVQLKDYFDQSGYKFPKKYVFEPTLNPGLRTHLSHINGSVEKKKQILVYGRPNSKRNAFELVVLGLRKWVELQDDALDWKIVSAGESHGKVNLGKGIVMESLGKLSIEEYAKVLEESYAGISLMVSPHPSYPPMEMATFGVRVITNSYANKDMTHFNENIVSLNWVNPDSIGEVMNSICDEYSYKKEVMIDKNTDYCKEKDDFSFVPQIIETVF